MRCLCEVIGEGEDCISNTRLAGNRLACLDAEGLDVFWISERESMFEAPSYIEHEQETTRIQETEQRTACCRHAEAAAAVFACANQPVPL